MLALHRQGCRPMSLAGKQAVMVWQFASASCTGLGPRIAVKDLFCRTRGELTLGLQMNNASGLPLMTLANLMCDQTNYFVGETNQFVLHPANEPDHRFVQVQWMSQTLVLCKPSG